MKPYFYICCLVALASCATSPEPVFDRCPHCRNEEYSKGTCFEKGSFRSFDSSYSYVFPTNTLPHKTERLFWLGDSLMSGPVLRESIKEPMWGQRIFAYPILIKGQKTKSYVVVAEDENDLKPAVSQKYYVLYLDSIAYPELDTIYHYRLLHYPSRGQCVGNAMSVEEDANNLLDQLSKGVSAKELDELTMYEYSISLRYGFTKFIYSKGYTEPFLTF